jgi:hypothetical protein
VVRLVVAVLLAMVAVGWFLPADARLGYALGVVIAVAAGILLNRAEARP